MKYLLFGLFLIPVVCFAQSKGDSKIIVRATDTANILNRIAAVLYDKGYSLEQKDESVGFLITAPKFERKVVGSRKIKALVKGNTIEFTGLCRLELGNYEKDRFEPVEFKGMKGSLYMVAWSEMNEIAQGFGSVTYSR